MPAIRERLNAFNSRGIIPTLRAMFYALVSLQVINNLQPQYQYLSHFTARAREKGELPIDCFADQSRRIVEEFDDRNETLNNYIERGLNHLACIAFSSVTRLFTQSDAVSRLLSYEFLPFAEEEGYSTEDEINDRFEEIRPQILACMYHAMSKAINIRNRIHGKYSLGRMADVLEWSEAISQALGYEPGLYLKRYDRLKKIQNRHSSSYDPLIYYYRKIYFDIFLKPASEFLSGSLTPNDESIRKKGYIIFSSKELTLKLNGYAEEDEYDTKKSNKLWPQDSQQLANRTREVSITISKNDGFVVEVRKGKHNSNEYFLGTKEAVEKYIESQEDDHKKRQVERENDPNTENSSNEINKMKVVQKSVQLNTLNAAGAHPLSAPATFDVDDQSNIDNKSWKSKIGAPSGGVQLSGQQNS